MSFDNDNEDDFDENDEDELVELNTIFPPKNCEYCDQKQGSENLPDYIDEAESWVCEDCYREAIDERREWIESLHS